MINVKNVTKALIGCYMGIGSLCAMEYGEDPKMHESRIEALEYNMFKYEMQDLREENVRILKSTVIGSWDSDILEAWEKNKYILDGLKAIMGFYSLTLPSLNLSGLLTANIVCKSWHDITNTLIDSYVSKEVNKYTDSIDYSSYGGIYTTNLKGEIDRAYKVTPKPDTSYQVLRYTSYLEILKNRMQKQ